MVKAIISLVLIIGLFVLLNHLETLRLIKRSTKQLKINNYIKSYNAWYRQLMDLNDIINNREDMAVKLKDVPELSNQWIKDRDKVLQHQIHHLMKDYRGI